MRVASGAMCRDEAGPLATSQLKMTASMYPFMEPHGLKLAAGSVEQYGQYPGHQHHPHPAYTFPPHHPMFPHPAADPFSGDQSFDIDTFYFSLKRKESVKDMF